MAHVVCAGCGDYCQDWRATATQQGSLCERCAGALRDSLPAEAWAALSEHASGPPPKKPKLGPPRPLLVQLPLPGD
ncbi:MAG TPA: hypothetical protein VMV92_10450 [Streptosporangiaceae bacterium]|nr:hypothetical protein [Streptosporangiaceae bacterium]